MLLKFVFREEKYFIRALKDRLKCQLTLGPNQKSPKLKAIAKQVRQEGWCQRNMMAKRKKEVLSNQGIP